GLDEERIATGLFTQQPERFVGERDAELFGRLDDRLVLGWLIEGSDWSNVEQALGIGLRVREHPADCGKTRTHDERWELVLVHAVAGADHTREVLTPGVLHLVD